MQGLNAVALERRISEEGFTALTPPNEPPEWLGYFGDEQPRVWTMDAAGNISRSWEWVDMVSWHDVVAVRLEWRDGKPIDVLDLDSDDWDYF